MSTKFKQLMADIQKQNYKGLDVLHHYLAGLKAIHTQDCTDSLYVIRQSLGGAGFTAWSGIPRIIEDYAPQVTYEGDNTVMLQQSANFLFKELKKAKQGKSRTKHDPVFDYLSHIDELKAMKCPASRSEHFLNLNQIEEAIKVNVAYKLDRVFTIM